MRERIKDAAEAVREQGEECGSKKDSMPDSLQEGPSGELLQERIEACESAAQELEDLAEEEFWNDVSDVKEHDDLPSDEEGKAMRLGQLVDLIDKVEDGLSGISWEV
mgnify:CR=1 FL=1